MGRAHGAPGAAFHLPSVKPKLQVVQTDWCRCPKQFGLVFHFSAYKKSWFGAIKLPSWAARMKVCWVAAMEWLWVIPCLVLLCHGWVQCVAALQVKRAHHLQQNLAESCLAACYCWGRVMRMGFVKAVLQIFVLCSLAAQGYLKQHLLLRSHSCYTSLDPILLLLKTSSSFGLVV